MQIPLLTQEFAKMVRGLEDEKLDGWLAEASEAAVIKSSPVGDGPLGSDEALLHSP